MELLTNLKFSSQQLHLSILFYSRWKKASGTELSIARQINFYRAFRGPFLFISTLASSKPTSDKADATSNECSLQLPHKSPMAPGYSVEPEPSTDGHNQQNHQTSLSEVPHLPSRAATRASRAANLSSKGSAAPVSMNCAQAI